MKASDAASIAFGLMGAYLIVLYLPAIAMLPFLLLREDLAPNQMRLPFLAVLGSLVQTSVPIVCGGVLIVMRRRLARRLVGPKTPEDAASTLGSVTEALAFSLLGAYFAVRGGAGLVSGAVSAFWDQPIGLVVFNSSTVSALIEFLAGAVLLLGPRWVAARWRQLRGRDDPRPGL